MNKYILWSGGLNSTVLLYSLLKKHDSIIPLFFYHRNDELNAVNKLEKHESLSLINGKVKKINCADFLAKQNSQSSRAPSFNLYSVLLSSLIYVPEKNSEIYFGIGAEEYLEYSSLIGPFITFLRKNYDVVLKTPFRKKTKKVIAVSGLSLNVPLDLTFSCDCNTCIKCISRQKTFIELNIK